MSWRTYGGLQNKKTADQITTESLTCDSLSVRNAYEGEFDISGDLVVYEGIFAERDVDIQGNLYANQNEIVQGNVDIKSNLIVEETATVINSLIMGLSGETNFFYTTQQFTGLNTLTPQATLDIVSNNSNVLHVHSQQPTTHNVVSENQNMYGVSISSMDSSSTLLFTAQDNNTFTTTTYSGVPLQNGYLDGFQGTLNHPYGIVADLSGSLYVTDGDVLRKITQTSQGSLVTTIAGTPGLYGLQDGSYNTVLVNNTVITDFNSRFNNAQAITMDTTNQTLYIADTGNNTIRRGLLQQNGTYYIDTLVDLSGNSLFFSQPLGIAMDSSLGILYVADTNQSVIQTVIVTPSGCLVNVYAGTLGTQGFQDGINALFRKPSSLGLDASGILYCFDSENAVLRQITNTPQGTLVSTLAGTPGISGYKDGPGSSSLLDIQANLTVYNNGTLYLSEPNNNTIRQITPPPPGGTGGYYVSTVAGIPLQSGYVDDVGNKSQFTTPGGLVVTTNKVLFVADTGNNLIRQLSPLITPYNDTIPCTIQYLSDYNSGKSCFIYAPDYTVLQSSVVIQPPNSSLPTATSFRGGNETLLLYPPKNNNTDPYLKDIYFSTSQNTTTCTSLNLVTVNDASSNTFMRWTTGTKSVGLGGGSYPVDTTRSMGVWGWDNKDTGNFEVSQMIVSGSQGILNKSTVGINTYFPQTDQYVMDVHGPVRISDGGIYQATGIMPMAPFLSDSFETWVMAVGTPSTIGNGQYIPFLHDAWVSIDGGQNWNSYEITCQDPLSTLQFRKSNSNFISLCLFNSTEAVVGSDTGYLFYTSSKGQTWSQIKITGYQGPLSSLYVDTVHRVLYCTDAISALAYSVTLPNPSTTPPLDISLSANLLSFPNGITINGYQVNGYNTNVLFTASGGCVLLDTTSMSITQPITLDVNYTMLSTTTTGQFLLASSQYFTYYDTNSHSIYHTSLIGNTNLLTTTTTTIHSISLFSPQAGVAVLFDSLNNIYQLAYKDPQTQRWDIIPETYLNSAGTGSLLQQNQPNSIQLLSNDVILWCNQIKSYSLSTNTPAQGTLLYIHLPFLFDVNNQHLVMDISGSLRLSDKLTTDQIETTQLFVTEAVNNKGYSVYNDGSVETSAQSDVEFDQLGLQWHPTSGIIPVIPTAVSQTQQPFASSVTGELQYLLLQGILYASRNYGLTWITLLTSIPVSESVIACSANGMYLTTAGNTNDGLLRTSSDGGVTWMTSPHPQPLQQSVFYISVSGNGQYRTLINNQSVFVSSDFGITWILSYTTESNNTNAAVVVSTTGRNQRVLFQQDGLVISDDFGRTWQSVQNNITSNALAFSSDISCQTLVIGCNNGAYLSTDSGNSWSPLTGVSTTQPVQAAAISASGIQQIIAVGNELYQSLNTGSTWTLIFTTTTPIISLVLNDTGKYLTALDANGYVTVSITPQTFVATNQLYITANDLSLNVANLRINGNVFAKAYNVTSDYRIKTDPHTLDSRMSVDDLRPVQYYNELTHQQDIGFLAHEIQQHYPFLVTGDKDGREYQSVNYIGLIGILVKEIQQLKLRNPTTSNL